MPGMGSAQRGMKVARRGVEAIPEWASVIPAGGEAARRGTAFAQV